MGGGQAPTERNTTGQSKSSAETVEQFKAETRQEMQVTAETEDQDENIFDLTPRLKPEQQTQQQICQMLMIRTRRQ